jgi:hypothetical protein
MDDHDEMRVGAPVQVGLNGGAIWRFGKITWVEGDTVVVDLGADGSVTTSRRWVRPL